MSLQNFSWLGDEGRGDRDADAVEFVIARGCTWDGVAVVESLRQCVRQFGRCKDTSSRVFENLTCGVCALGFDWLDGDVIAGGIEVLH